MSAAEIKALRLKLGLSQGEIAARIGCRRSTWNEWESGKRSPSAPYLRALKRLAQE